MASSNVETYRDGHGAFNQRDFEAMTKQYADRIAWTDHPQGRTFSTPQDFKDDWPGGLCRLLTSGSPAPAISTLAGRPGGGPGGPAAPGPDRDHARYW
jgi:hypothetical protein